MTAHWHTSDPLVSKILRRSHSLFAEDLENNRSDLREIISNKRILIVGSAGSIGQSFVRVLCSFSPKAIHLIDLSENGLAELVRDLRSSNVSLPDDFRTFAVDFGSPIFHKLIAHHGPYDAFVNFAALKHVRSERDVFSLLRMIETNVQSLDEALNHLSLNQYSRVFSVSTDKAVHPSNLMGVTKNLMEKVLFSHAHHLTASTARFANVLFSEGSLLSSFESRLIKGQPLAGPSNIQRYFISHEEAGELCLIACFLGDNRAVHIPRLAPTELTDFASIAETFLHHHGFEPRFCDTEEEARRLAEQKNSFWPCYFAPADTAGEKPYEEFHSKSEKIDYSRFHAVGVAIQPPADRTILTTLYAEILSIRKSDHWSKKDVTAALSRAVPELSHINSGKSLDEKM